MKNKTAKETKVLKRTAKFMRTALVDVKLALERDEDAAMILVDDVKKAIATIDKVLAKADPTSPHVVLDRETLESAKCSVAWVSKYTLLYFNDTKSMVEEKLTMDAWARVA